MDLDEGLAGTGAGFMERLGKQFLAGAAFPTDKDYRVRGGDFADQVEELLHHQSRANNTAGGDGRQLRLGGARFFTGSALAPQPGLQGEDAALLFRDFFQLDLEVAIELLDGSVTLGAFQGQDGDLSERGQ